MTTEIDRTAVAVHCASCEMLAINGIACHETGCPDAWKGREVECRECGSGFIPEERGERYCSQDCAERASC